MVSVLGYIGIGFLLFIVLSFFFRRYISALFYDYVIDGGLSFADNLLAGAGAIGLDFGDWIAAVLIFVKERKITNGFMAGIVAWEATNFIPFSLIPVIGEVIEVIFNLFPAVTFGRMMFNKFGPAEKEEKKLEKNISLAERFGIGVSKEKKVLIDVQKLIKKEDPVGALREAKKSDEEIYPKLIKHVDELMADTDSIIKNIMDQNVQAPPEILNILQEGINASDLLLQQAKTAEENKDLDAAIKSATEAKDTIISAAEQFDAAFQQNQSVLPVVSAE